jgi:hypothetical protein
LAAGLAFVALRAILMATGGEPAVPLDDAFIHFQYARSFAELKPLVYSPGAEPAPGATSLLWAALLAPFWAAGLRDAALIWVAWSYGFGALALLCAETRRLAEGLLSPESALCAGLMVAAFSGYAWFAASGMEVVPFAWMLARTARRAAEYSELAALGRGALSALGGRYSRRFGVISAELCVLGLLAPSMRPEGALASAFAAGVLLMRASGFHRAWSIVPLAGPLVPPALNWLFTGQALNTTAVCKWLLLSPYQYGGRTVELVAANARLLLGTLLDGRIWSALFLPTGGRVIAWLCLPALLLAGVQSRRNVRAFAVLLLALGMFIPATYESFLWNRLRYLWPFAVGWFIGLAAIGDALGRLAGHLRAELTSLRWLFGGICVGALASHLSPAIGDLATSADAIRRQQAALGRWARDTLPESASLGVNDTGAIAYFSGRRTFDVVGLTTRNEARYWVNGAGSRFEHYEKLPRHALPSHFIVYPEWFGIPGLLGEELTRRTVPGATILGGETMAAYRADYSLLGSGTLPEAAPGSRLLDSLDVADLESEWAHAYALYHATERDNSVVQPSEERADGGRGQRTHEYFELAVAPGGRLVARLASDAPTQVAVRIANRLVGEFSLTGNTWDEPSLVIPTGVPAGRQRVELTGPDERRFTALHYWSYAAGSPAP